MNEQALRVSSRTDFVGEGVLRMRVRSMRRWWLAKRKRWANGLTDGLSIGLRRAHDVPIDDSPGWDDLSFCLPTPSQIG